MQKIAAREVIIPIKTKNDNKNQKKEKNDCFIEIESFCYYITKSLEGCQCIKCEYYKSVNPINDKN